MGILTSEINKYLNFEFNSTATADPTTFYIDLSTSEILSDGSGSTVVIGSGYSSVSLAANSNNWTEPVEGEVTNAVMVSFPSGSLVSGDDWGTIKAIVVRNSPAAITPIFWSNLTPYIEAPVGTRISFSGGMLKLGRRDRIGE